MILKVFYCSTELRKNMQLQIDRPPIQLMKLYHKGFHGPRIKMACIPLFILKILIAWCDSNNFVLLFVWNGLTTVRQLLIPLTNSKSSRLVVGGCTARMCNHYELLRNKS